MHTKRNSSVRGVPLTGWRCEVDTATWRELVRRARWRATRHCSSHLHRNYTWTRDTGSDAHVFQSTYTHYRYVMHSSRHCSML